MNLKIIFYITMMLSVNPSANAIVEPAPHPPDIKLCVAKVARKYLPEIEALSSSDKVKHCGLSCYLAYHCTAGGSLGMGVLKEISDLIFQNGEPSIADIRADYKGVRLGFRKKWKEPGLDCIQSCFTIYPSKND